MRCSFKLQMSIDGSGSCLFQVALSLCPTSTTVRLGGGGGGGGSGADCQDVGFGPRLRGFRLSACR
jgi:hypothetical protein